MSDLRSYYRSLAVLGARYARHAEAPSARSGYDLTPFELKVSSQNGEDGVIEEILARIGTGNRRFVEFGVESGVEGNCVFLADVLGWGGCFMEGDANAFAALERKYRTRADVLTIHARVLPGTVNRLFAAAAVATEPDVLSIDVDGLDCWIWRALDGYRPRVVVIEYNSSLDPDARLTVPPDESFAWDGTDYFGASLGALRHVGREKGYRLVHTDLAGVNAFFVRNDLARAFVAEERVIVRGPNYFNTGRGHPPDPRGRPYVDPAV
jgi:hypothetical protein